MYSTQSNAMQSSDLKPRVGGPAVKDAGPSRIRYPAAGDLFNPHLTQIYTRAKSDRKMGNRGQTRLKRINTPAGLQFQLVRRGSYVPSAWERERGPSQTENMTKVGVLPVSPG